MRTTHVSLGLCAIAAAAALFTACKKDPDSPEEHTIPTGGVLTLDSLINMYVPGNTMHFDTTDWSVYATVTADETNGNLYKEVYVQDGNAAINMRLLTSGGLYQGDRIRIYLPGTILSSYNGMLQLDSVNVDLNVVKQAVDVWVEPAVVTIAQINSGSPDLKGHLVRINTVEFLHSDSGMTYADAAGQNSVNHSLEECSGDQIIVRTSGYANFANLQLPIGGGSIVAIVGYFAPDYQLYIRDLAEVQLNGNRCAGAGPSFFTKDFEDLDLSSGGWTQQDVSGSIPWAPGNYLTYNYSKINNFVGGVNIACETWYISPAVNITVTPTPYLTFQTAAKFAGTPLAVLVSTDYDGVSAPSTATWTALAPTLSPDAYLWTGSGALDLSPYSSTNFHVAFKYVGTSSDGRVYELDDIVFHEY